MSKLVGILNERGATSGDFMEHARVTQGMKTIMATSIGWVNMSFVQRETLEMEAHKIGRVLAGDPAFAEHWADLAGYNMLVHERLSPLQAGLSRAHTHGEYTAQAAMAQYQTEEAAALAKFKTLFPNGTRPAASADFHTALQPKSYYTLVANCLSGPPVPVPVRAVAPDLESEMATLISSSGSGVFAEAQVIE